MLIYRVVIGSLLAAASPVRVAFGRLHSNDKVLHFCGYLALSSLPVIGFRDRRRGIVTGVSMFLRSAIVAAGRRREIFFREGFGSKGAIVPVQREMEKRRFPLV